MWELPAPPLGLPKAQPSLQLAARAILFLPRLRAPLLVPPSLSLKGVMMRGLLQPSRSAASQAGACRGEHRGPSRRDRISLASKYYVVLAGYDGVVYEECSANSDQ